jgi:hypothetical protein
VKECRNIKHGACVCMHVYTHTQTCVRVLLVIVEFKTPDAGNEKKEGKDGG